MSNKLVEDIKQEEGFRQFPYYCTEGKLTIGYGFNLDDVGIDEEEAELLLMHRLKKTINAVNSSLYDYDMKPEAWDILYQMAYQMGVSGLLKFKKMLTALKKQDYEEASKEGKDSLWYKQTTNRAERLMNQMKSLA